MIYIFYVKFDNNGFIQFVYMKIMQVLVKNLKSSNYINVHKFHPTDVR